MSVDESARETQTAARKPRRFTYRKRFFALNPRWALSQTVCLLRGNGAMDRGVGRAGERMGPARLFAAAILAALAAASLAARAGDEVSRPVAVGVKLVQ